MGGLGAVFGYGDGENAGFQGFVIVNECGFGFVLE